MSAATEDLDLVEAVTGAAGDERAAIVAFLRAKADEAQAGPFSTMGRRAIAAMTRDTLIAAAAAIEHGEHRG